MAILKLDAPSQLLIDLRGPDGNAYVLIGLAQRLGKTLGLSPDVREDIANQMRSKDYNHLVHVMDHYFGHCVNFVLPETMLKEWDPTYSIFAEATEDLAVEVLVKDVSKPSVEASVEEKSKKLTTKRVKL